MSANGCLFVFAFWCRMDLVFWEKIGIVFLLLCGRESLV